MPRIDVNTDPFHKEALHLSLNRVEKLHLAVTMMILEINNYVHHHQHLGRKHIVSTSSTFLQIQLKCLQRSAPQQSVTHIFLLLTRYVPNAVKDEYMRSV